MNIPHPTAQLLLNRMIPAFSEMLTYCAAVAVESGVEGSLAYNVATDEVTYHLPISPIDRELFTYLHDVEEVWIVTGAGVES